MLVVKRIHVEDHLKADDADRETVERVHDMHVDRCPIARSIRDSVQITTELIVE